LGGGLLLIASGGGGRWRCHWCGDTGRSADRAELSVQATGPRQRDSQIISLRSSRSTSSQPFALTGGQNGC